jgi:predicted nucleic acid-binding protein
LSLLQTLPILIDETSTAATMSSIIALGRKHNVSSYDAAYLELAMRQGFQLATLDEDLRKTAAALGVSIVTVGDK